MLHFFKKVCYNTNDLIIQGLLNNPLKEMIGLFTPDIIRRTPLKAGIYYILGGVQPLIIGELNRRWDSGHKTTFA